MKKSIIIKKKILFSLIIVFASIISKGQETKTGDGVYLSLSQLVYPEIVITYEQFIKNNLSMSYSLGYKIPIGTDSTITSFGTGSFAVYENQYMFNEYSSALFTSIAPSYYFGRKRKFYLQSELFYRYYWINDKKLQYNEPYDKDYYSSIRSEKNHTIGLRLLAGINSRIKLSDKLLLDIKTYGGLSIKYKNYLYENVDSKVYDVEGNSTIIPYHEEKGDVFVPSFHIGMKIGIAKYAPISN